MNLSLGENLTSAKGGFAFSVTVVVYVFLSLVLSLIIELSGAAGTQGALYAAYLVSPAAIAAGCAATVFAGKLGFRQAFPVRCKLKYYAIALLLVFGLMFSLGTVNGYLVQFLETLGYQPRSSTLPDLDGWGIVWAVLVIAVIPAVFEEALFRGVILNNAEEGAGTLRAVLLCGFVFSLYHGSVEQTVYQFICGCLFALLAVRSRSVLPSVVIHFINNALILVFSRFGLFDELGNLAMPPAVNVAVTVLSAVSFVAATLLLVLDRAQTKPKKEGGVCPFFVWGALGTVIMAVLWIAGLFGL